jgi:putative transposase
MILNIKSITKRNDLSKLFSLTEKEGFIYLTTILDLHDRKIIGWSSSNGMSTDETALGARKMVVKTEILRKV